jgi:integrase
MAAPLGAAEILGGRREQALLALPSVSRMAGMLAARCREASWVRTSVASLDRFRVMTGRNDLEGLLDRARSEPHEAERALLAFAAALDGYDESQVAGLAMGPKIWFRLNGIPVPWRPLPAARSPMPRLIANQRPADALVLLALIGSGLRRAELLRLRLGDVGSLDAECRPIPDIEAEPLAVRYSPRAGRQGERITFLTYQARQALLADLAGRREAGQPCGTDAPLVARPDGSPATASTVVRARRRTASLIRAGAFVNVDLCRATGEFFREWGMPGSRFEGEDDLNIEEYI